MSETCDIPRTPHVADRAIARDLHRAISGLDIDGCNCRSIVMALREHEKATGPSFDRWPPAIQHQMNKEIERFQKEHPKAVIVAATQGVHLNCCVLALHWKAQT